MGNKIKFSIELNADTRTIIIQPHDGSIFSIIDIIQTNSARALWML